MWGVIKSSVNSNIGRPLNEQGYKRQSDFINIGGPDGSTVIESVLSINGSGYLHELLRRDTFNHQMLNPFTLRIFVDGEKFLEMSHTVSLSSQRHTLTYGRVAGYSFAQPGSDAAVNALANVPPIAFDTNLTVQLTKLNILATPNIVNFEVITNTHTSSTTENRILGNTSRVLFFNNNTTVTLPSDVLSDTVKVRLIGAGGTGNSAQIVPNLGWRNHGRPGENGEIIEQAVTIPASRTAQITIGVGGTNVAARATSIQFSGGETITAAGGANGIGHLESGTRTAPAPAPAYLWGNHGRGGQGGNGSATHSTDADARGSIGSSGRVIIEYEVI